MTAGGMARRLVFLTLAVLSTPVVVVGVLLAAVAAALVLGVVVLWATITVPLAALVAALWALAGGVISPVLREDPQ